MKVSKKRLARLVVMYALTLYVSRENCRLTGDWSKLTIMIEASPVTLILQT
jgi:hypothetical protein